MLYGGLEYRHSIIKSFTHLTTHLALIHANWHQNVNREAIQCVVNGVVSDIKDD